MTPTARAITGTTIGAALLALSIDHSPALRRGHRRSRPHPVGSCGRRDAGDDQHWDQCLLADRGGRHGSVARAGSLNGGPALLGTDC